MELGEGPGAGGLPLRRARPFLFAAHFTKENKEIEENNRIGKTIDLLKKIRDTKGIFHAKMGTIKDRNSKNLTEAEEIKKRWQEYTEEPFF